MSESSDKLEAIKLVSDWGKWLVTVETVGITVVGAYFTAGHPTVPVISKVCATIAVVSFLISIAAAAFLLLSLPEIAQRGQPNQNVWVARDSVIGRVLRFDIEGLAVVESAFFGLGLVAIVVMVLGIIWA